MWQDELQRRRLFRLLLRLRRRGAAPRCFQQHPLISKASSATANTARHSAQDTGVCLSQAQQQMMLKDANSSEQERGSVAKKGWAATRTGRFGTRTEHGHWSPYQYFSLDQKHFGSKSAPSVSPCCDSHHGAAREFDSCQVQVGTRAALTTAPPSA